MRPLPGHWARLPLVLAVSPCASPQYGSLRERAAAEGMCDDAPVQRLIGQKATQELGVRALEASRARTFEWIRPGMIVTTGFSPWRLRVTYDETQTVVEIRCG